MDTRRISRRRLLAWYEAHGRHELPWRQTRDPYAVLASEVMLQQTQVGRVLVKYEEFLSRFPTFEELAAASAGAVIRAWSGLGYNRRAVRLQEAARAAVAAGGLPGEVVRLRQLPGVGPYTAAAVACFAFDAHVAVVDTNVRRVLVRALLGDETASPSVVGGLAANALPRTSARDWNLALMDLGAAVCTARAPACDQCPIAQGCAWRARTREWGTCDGSTNVVRSPGERFQGSRRYYRGRIIEALRLLPEDESLAWEELGRRIRNDYDESREPWLRDLVNGLAADGLACVRGDRVLLPDERCVPTR